MACNDVRGFAGWEGNVHPLLRLAIAFARKLELSRLGTDQGRARELVRASGFMIARRQA
jgi:hypothetical protein